MNWTDLEDAVVYTLAFFGDGVFEIFLIDVGETAKTIGGLQADKVYQAEITANLMDGSEERATGQVRTLSG